MLLLYRLGSSHPQHPMFGDRQGADRQINYRAVHGRMVGSEEQSTETWILVKRRKERENNKKGDRQRTRSTSDRDIITHMINKLAIATERNIYNHALWCLRTKITPLSTSESGRGKAEHPPSQLTADSPH